MAEAAPEPLDLEAVAKQLSLVSDPEGRVVVTRSWLQRAYDELTAGREAKAALDRAYGSLPL